ncbi:MAG: hypothetical protein GX629_08310, partial [Phycisphaerae bacterium]|nr:hypothetical protein [Phycisphaerae bacterium]
MAKVGRKKKVASKATQPELPEITEAIAAQQENSTAPEADPVDTSTQAQQNTASGAEAEVPS